MAVRFAWLRKPCNRANRSICGSAIVNAQQGRSWQLGVRSSRQTSRNWLPSAVAQPALALGNSNRAANRRAACSAVRLPNGLGDACQHGFLSAICSVRFFCSVEILCLWQAALDLSWPGTTERALLADAPRWTAPNAFQGLLALGAVPERLRVFDALRNAC